MLLDVRTHYQMYLRRLIEDRGFPQLFATLNPNVRLNEEAFRKAIESTHRLLNIFTCSHHYYARREPAAELAQPPDGKSWITGVSITEAGKRTIPYRHAHWMIWCQSRHTKRLRECFSDAFQQGINRPKSEVVVDVKIDDFNPDLCEEAITYVTKEVPPNAEHFDRFQLLAA